MTSQQTMRFGGWRPTVFMEHGLMVGMWMSMAAMIGLWLWWTGTLKRVCGNAHVVSFPRRADHGDHVQIDRRARSACRRPDRPGQPSKWPVRASSSGF
jgi:hypothetical protein